MQNKLEWWGDWNWQYLILDFEPHKVNNSLRKGPLG